MEIKRIQRNSTVVNVLVLLTQLLATFELATAILKPLLDVPYHLTANGPGFNQYMNGTCNLFNPNDHCFSKICNEMNKEKRPITYNFSAPCFHMNFEYYMHNSAGAEFSFGFAVGLAFFHILLTFTYLICSSFESLNTGTLWKNRLLPSSMGCLVAVDLIISMLTLAGFLVVKIYVTRKLRHGLMETSIVETLILSLILSVEIVMDLVYCCKEYPDSKLQRNANEESSLLED